VPAPSTAFSAPTSVLSASWGSSASNRTEFSISISATTSASSAVIAETIFACCLASAAASVAPRASPPKWTK
jgi:hypothetical protein